MSTTNKFYNLLWGDDQCQNIFLLHKEQLLEKQEVAIDGTKKHFYLPRFVLSNSLKRKDTRKRIEQRIQDRNIDNDHSLNSIVLKNINEEKIIAFFKGKFGKSIDLITKKLNEGRISEMRFFVELAKVLFSEKQLILFLKKYQIIDNEINSINELSNSFRDALQNEILPVINSDHIVDIFESFNTISCFYENYIFNNLMASDKFYTDIFYDTENFKTRLELFDTLYEANVLLGGYYKAYYECTHCQINTFSGNVTLNVTPSKIKLKCPNCSKEVFYIVPYKLDDSIFSDIQSTLDLVSRGLLITNS